MEKYKLEYELDKVEKQIERCKRRNKLVSLLDLQEKKKQILYQLSKAE